MGLKSLMRNKQISKYQLSKKSGVAWEIINELYERRVLLSEIDSATLDKLSEALGVSKSELLTVDESADDVEPDNTPRFEVILPISLQKAIDDFVQGEKEKPLHLDCLWDELYGSINSNMWANCITEAQADYLRKKYLGLYNDEDEEEEYDDRFH